MLKIFVSTIGDGFLQIFYYVYNLIPDFIGINAMDVSTYAVMSFFSPVNIQMLKIVAPFFIFGFAVTLLVNILQVGWKVSTKPMQPKLDRFNPVNGMKRIISKDSVFELFKSLIKIALILYIAYTAIKDHENDLFILYDIPLNQAITLCGDVIIGAGLKISLVYLVVGIADFIYQKYRFNAESVLRLQRN